MTGLKRKRKRKMKRKRRREVVRRKSKKVWKEQ